MWTCVKCGAQVDDGFDYCGWCGTSPEGVEDPSFAEASEPSAIPEAGTPVETTTVAEARVTVATARLPEHAHTLRCHLEAAGIPVFVPGQPPGGMDWARSGGGDIPLQVRDIDIDRAKRVLADIPPEEVVSQPAEPPPVAALAVAPAATTPGATWEPANRASLTTKEYLRALESRLSALMDEHDLPGWKVNPAYHPEVNAFIQSHSDQPIFVKSAHALQQNRAKYYATMRARAEQKAAAAAPALTAPVAVPDPVVAKTSPWPHRIRRTIAWTAFLLLVVVNVFLVLVIYTRVSGQQELEDTLARTDQLDPGWRWEDLQAHRAEVPEEQNAALQVEAAAKELPANWPGDDPVWKEVRNLPITSSLSPEQVEKLTTALKDPHVTAAVVAARSLALYSTGRYPSSADGQAAWKGNERVAELLWYYAALLSQDRRTVEALDCVRAILIVGRSVGDDPDPEAQFGFRLRCQQLAFSSLERTLAQARYSASDPPARTRVLSVALAETQKLFEDELNQPIALCGLRGLRAQLHQARMPHLNDDTVADLLHVARQKSTPDAEAPPLIVDDFNGWMALGLFRQDQAWALDQMSRAVEAAKLPPEDQTAALQKAVGGSGADEFDTAWPVLVEERSGLAKAPVGEMARWVDRFRRGRAELTLAVTALAVERYRLSHDDAYPENLTVLVPDFLPRVLLDPYTNQPLILSSPPDGLVIAAAPPVQGPITFRLSSVEHLSLPRERP